MHLFAEKEYEFPARIFLPSGNDVVLKTFKDGQDFAESLRKRYEEVLKASKTPEDKMVAQEFYDDYLKLTNDLKKIRTSYNIRERKGGTEPSYEGLAKFPMQFNAPSGAIYTLNNFNDFKKFKDENFWKKELEAKGSSKEYPTTKEKLLKDADADYRYLMGEREKLLTKGWENKGKDKYWFKRGTKEQNEEREEQYKDLLRRTWGIKPKRPAPTITQEQEAPSQPPAATAQQPQPAEAKPETKTRSRSRSRIRIAEQRPAQTRARTPAATEQQPQRAEGNVPQARTQPEEKKATVKEPIQIDEETLNAALLSRVLADENLDNFTKQFTAKLIEEMSRDGGYDATYDKVKSKFVNKYQGDTETPEEVKKEVLDAINNIPSYRDETLAQLIAQQEAEPQEAETIERDEEPEEDREYFSPHEENEGEVYDTEQDLGVNPETLTRLGIHAAGRRLAREPYEENKDVGVPDFNEMELEGIRTFNELAEDAKQPKRRSESYEQVQKLLNDYIDPERRNERVETLKDRLISTVRERAQQRLMKAYEKLGMKLSAAGMGRSGYEEKMRQEMAKEMEIELYERELQETMKLHQQEEENAKNRLSTALQAYIINQKEEEARKNEQRRAASDRIATGKYVSDRLQLGMDKKAEEFVRRKEHPWRAQERLADLLNRTTLGEPKPYEPLQDEIRRPEVVPQAAPPAVEREIGPTHVPPALGHAPERDTTFADTTAAGLGLGKLVLDAYNTFGGGSKKEEAKA